MRTGLGAAVGPPRDPRSARAGAGRAAAARGPLRRGWPPRVPRRWHRARPAARPRDHRRLRPHDRRAARRETKRLLEGWADAVWTQGERFGTIGARKGERSYEITTHRAEAYHPDSRKPDVAFADEIEADLSRRDFTVNAMALALPDPRARRPVRRRRRPRRRPSAHAALAGGVVHRRPAADAARGRASSPATASRPTTSSSTRSASCAAGSRSCRPSASATSSTSSSSVDHPSAGSVVPRRHRALRRVPARAARACGSSKTRSTATRTCSPTRSRSSRTDARAGRRQLSHRAARRALPRRRQAEDALVRPRDGVVPPPRGRRRADDARAHAGAALLDRRHRGRDAARRAAPALPHATRWAGPTARCAATCATPDRCSTS